MSSFARGSLAKSLYFSINFGGFNLVEKGEFDAFGPADSSEYLFKENANGVKIGGNLISNFNHSVNYSYYNSDRDNYGPNSWDNYKAKGKRKGNNVDGWLVRCSHNVLKSIKDEGILETLTESGFKLREPGCSACLAMNDDKIPKGKYAVSTTNRNFEGRQGPGARTLLASPLVAAATAITGQITDPREII